MDSEKESTGDEGYTVVARRYRPKSFAELIGQDHIAQALGKAISAGRVGHAYLFTGARGVGKTSTARIFAKALNVPDDRPDLAEEMSRAIDTGDDMDVIEIDGASNRGIEEIRQLRANVHVRPSRARYKIYIIDEVHMLTNQAFNALLKTLEEPPGHVKFIFCTTDPDKIPITVLSRCQRFDFAPVAFEAIQGRLKEICAAEGFSVDDESLALLARRAAGSMRDSQSLLEQVMSFATDAITVEQVHALLGTADEGRLAELVQALRGANSLQAVQLVDAAIRSGADAGQLAEQLLNYLRDVMAAGVGGGPELLKIASPNSHAELVELAHGWGIQTVLSAIQILDEMLVRMRASVSAVTLLEVAMVQICQLEHLASIPALLEQFAAGPASGERGTGDQKKKHDGAPVVEPVAAAAPAPSSAPASATRVASVAPPTANSAGESATPPSSTPTESSTASPASDATSTVAEATVHETQAEVGQRQPGNPTAVEVDTESSRSSTAASVSAGQASNTNAAVATQPHAVQTTAPTNDTAVTAAAPTAASATTHQPDAPQPSSAHATMANQPAGSSDALRLWKESVAGIDGMLADFAGMAQSVEPDGSDHWKVVFPPGAHKPLEYCGQGDRKAVLQQTLAQKTGRTIQLSFAVLPGEAPKSVAPVPQSSLRAQKLREMSEHPYVKRLCEVLDGEIIRVDAPRDSAKMAGNQSNSNA